MSSSEKNNYQIELKMPQPAFSSNLMDSIIELERLRHTTYLSGSIHPSIFFQLKDIFHKLESWASARIEGNNTTLFNLVEASIEDGEVLTKDEQLREISNNERALKFIEDRVKKNKNSKIDRALISEIHKIVVNELSPLKDGDSTPGEYRDRDVKIKNSDHIPPRHFKVQEYMDDLINFINKSKKQKEQLLVIAVAHHRFAWIHPFKNGNGRVVRLLTYAMLLSNGFSVDNILNPAAIFCSDREKYYNMLAAADLGTDQHILSWCDYVLSNLLAEIIKIDKLLDKKFLMDRILIPALNLSLKTKSISKVDYEILKAVFDKGEVMANDLNKILKKKYPSEVSLEIKRLKEINLLRSRKSSPRKYFANFANSPLLRGIVEMLKKENFVPAED